MQNQASRHVTSCHAYMRTELCYVSWHDCMLGFCITTHDITLRNAREQKSMQGVHLTSPKHMLPPIMPMQSRQCAQSWLCTHGFMQHHGHGQAVVACAQSWLCTHGIMQHHGHGHAVMAVCTVMDLPGHGHALMMLSKVMVMAMQLGSCSHAHTVMGVYAHKVVHSHIYTIMPLCIVMLMPRAHAHAHPQ